MVDIVSLGYEVDTRDVLKGQDALEDLAASTVRADGASKKLTGATSTLGVSMQRTAQQSSNLNRSLAMNSNAVRQVGQNLSQVVQQASVTGNVFQALTVQAADIGLAFGTVGIAVGAAITAFGALAPALLNSESAADRLESQMDALNQLLGSINATTALLEKNTRDLSAIYGQYADRVRKVAQVQAELQLSKLTDDFRTLTSVLADTDFSFRLTEQFLDVTSREARGLSASLGASVENTKALVDNLRILQGGAGLEEQQQAVLAISELLRSGAIQVEKFPPAFRSALTEAIRLSISTDEVRAAAERLSDASKEISFSGAISDAQKLADELGVSVGLAQQIANARNGGGRNNNGLDALDPRNPNNTRPIFDGATGNVSQFDPRRNRAASRSGGGRADPFEQNLSRLMDSLRTERETIEQWYADSEALLNDHRAKQYLTEQEYRESIVRLEREYQARLSNIRDGSHNDTLIATSSFFGSLAEITAAGGNRLVRATQAFAAIETLINTYRAQAQVLADPSLPFFAKFAAYAKIGAAGLSLVSAIKGAGGGSTAAGGGSVNPASQAAPQQTKTTIVDLGDSPDWLKGMADDMLKRIYEASRDGERVVVI